MMLRIGVASTSPHVGKRAYVADAGLSHLRKRPQLYQQRCLMQRCHTTAMAQQPWHSDESGV